MHRKTYPIPELEFLASYCEETLGSHKALAEKMTKDWQEDWTKESLDKLLASPCEPHGSTVAKIRWSLGLKGIPHPDKWKAREAAE